MTEHTAALPEMQPPPARRSKRGLVAVIATVVAVVLIAGGGYAAWALYFGSGPRPAEVLPASTFALATVDLDPSGGQKIEAIKTLRKFPSWRERTGITPDSDLVEAIFDEALKDGPCKSLDYKDDIEPWIGSRAGVGGVLLDDKPTPVVTLQIKDKELARTGFAKLAKCSEADNEEFGWTLTDDYLVGSDSLANAEAIVSAGKKAPLAENADFQKWTEEAGGPGILNVYVGRKSVQALTDVMGGELAGLTGEDGSAFDDDPGSEEELAKAFKDFKGAAAVLRFADGGIEFSFASGGATSQKDRAVAKHVGALPKDTAAVAAFAWPEKAMEQLKDPSNEGLGSFAEMFTEGTGLEFPDDLITLLGTSLSISVGADAPADLNAVSGLDDVPLGLLIHGDEAEIKAAIAKVESHTGQQLSELPATVSSGDGKVAISGTTEYGEQLLENGSLGDSKDFQDAVSHSEEAQGVLYVDLDSDWMDTFREMLAEEDDPEATEVADNLAVLRALGASAWSEGTTSHGLVRLSLK